MTCDRDAGDIKRGTEQFIRQGWRQFVERLIFRTVQNVECQTPSIGLVLIIQMNGWNGETLFSSLRSAGYAVQSVDERGALRAIKEAHPLLLIVGGAADLDLYRAFRCVATIPILALVPEAELESALSAFAVGVDDYQFGPISHGEIIARVGALLRSVHRMSRSKSSLQV
jgi:DNA-binding response OmpR family regulator